MLCRDLYVNGCERPITGPSWYHPEHFPPDGDRPRHLAFRDGVSEQMIRRLAGSSEKTVRVAVVAHAGTPTDVLDLLTEDHDEGVRAEALARTESKEPLRRGIQAAWAIRAAVALNPRCPTDLLDRLSRDSDWTVRARVVGNPSCPAHVVEAGLRDPHEHVRWWALSRTASVAVIRAAAISADPRDRAAVAGNPHCPAELVEALRTDPEEWVRASARRRLQ